MYKFRIFDFLFFKIRQIGLFWSKITIFIIEISVKLHLHIKNGWNNRNSHRLGLKSLKLNFLPFLAAQKIIVHTNIQIHITGSIFIVNLYFFILVTMSSIRINNNWNYQKMLITESTIKKCSLLWPGASQWRIYYHRMWGQLWTTCSNVLKQPNGELLVAVNHNQQRTMASETVDPIDWSHSPPSWAVPRPSTTEGLGSTPWAPRA